MTSKLDKIIKKMDGGKGLIWDAEDGQFMIGYGNFCRIYAPDGQVIVHMGFFDDRFTEIQ